MTVAETREVTGLDREARAALRLGHARLGLRGRGHDRAVRLARTIADLAGSERVAEAHVLEAMQLRRRVA